MKKKRSGTRVRKERAGPGVFIQNSCSPQSALSRCVVKPGLTVVTASVGSAPMGFAATSKSRPTGPTALVYNRTQSQPLRIDVYVYFESKFNLLELAKLRELLVSGSVVTEEELLVSGVGVDPLAEGGHVEERQVGLELEQAGVGVLGQQLLEVAETQPCTTRRRMSEA